MAILKQKDENGNWVEVPLGATSGVEVSETEPTNPMTQVWVDTSETEVIVDYIVEQGTKDGWVYRKWNSGIAECWRMVTEEALDMTKQQGSAWYGNITAVSLPILFNATPIANITTRTNGGGYLVNFAVETLNTTTLKGYCESVNGAIIKTVYIDIHLMGTWK